MAGKAKANTDAGAEEVAECPRGGGTECYLPQTIRSHVSLFGYICLG